MSLIQIDKKTTYHLELFVTDVIGNSVTGLNIDYVIYKCSNNSVIQSGSLNDLDNGVYHDSYTFNELGQFRIIYITPEKYADGMETVMVAESKAEQETLLRALGLVQENFRLINPVYTNGNMTGCTIKTYQSADDCNNNSNELAEYVVSASYSNGNCTSYKSVKL
jgi:hypothetical protein